jgi:hypothetical protein
LFANPYSQFAIALYFLPCVRRLYRRDPTQPPRPALVTKGAQPGPASADLLTPAEQAAYDQTPSLTVGIAAEGEFAGIGSANVGAFATTVFEFNRHCCLPTNIIGAFQDSL